MEVDKVADDLADTEADNVKVGVLDIGHGHGGYKVVKTTDVTGDCLYLGKSSTTAIMKSWFPHGDGLWDTCDP